MWNNPIGKRLRDGVHLLLFLNGMLIVAVIAVFAFNTRYFYNFFFGPFPADPATLVAEPSPDGLWEYYLAVDGSQTFEAGTETLRQLEKGSFETKVRSETL